MISKYSIQNKFLTVNINRLGAELCSVIDSEGTEFIWQAGEVWPKHAPNLFPIVGSLLDHEYTYQVIMVLPEIKILNCYIKASILSAWFCNMTRKHSIRTHLNLLF
jgi:hypothetical protein